MLLIEIVDIQEALDEIGLSKDETEAIFDLLCIQEGKRRRRLADYSFKKCSMKF